MSKILDSCPLYQAAIKTLFKPSGVIKASRSAVTIFLSRGGQAPSFKDLISGREGEVFEEVGGTEEPLEDVGEESVGGVEAGAGEELLGSKILRIVFNFVPIDCSNESNLVSIEFSKV